MFMKQNEELFVPTESFLVNMPSADATWRSWDFKLFFMIKTTEQPLYIIDLLINSMLTFRSRLNTTPHLRMLAWSTCADPESFVRGTPTLTFFCFS